MPPCLSTANCGEHCKQCDRPGKCNKCESGYTAIIHFPSSIWRCPDLWRLLLFLAQRRQTPVWRGTCQLAWNAGLIWFLMIHPLGYASFSDPLQFRPITIHNPIIFSNKFQCKSHLTHTSIKVVYISQHIISRRSKCERPLFTTYYLNIPNSYAIHSILISHNLHPISFNVLSKPTDTVYILQLALTPWHP